MLTLKLTLVLKTNTVIHPYSWKSNLCQENRSEHVSGKAIGEELVGERLFALGVTASIVYEQAEALISHNLLYLTNQPANPVLFQIL